jgi:hypothetical protein
MIKFIIIGVVIGTICGVVLGDLYGTNYHVRKTAIANNCGEYDRVTGEYHWIKQPTEQEFMNNFGYNAGIALPKEVTNMPVAKEKTHAPKKPVSH